ncbi:MAG: hypothetical protein C0613_15085 [Desulfobulbaceae bacterium]|nr:MAG: hypothetical protein C0613_15085 [Desulfobulbaceae bacterium]
MALITPVPQEQAQGVIKKGYEMFLERVGTIPRPMEMLSVSPGMFDLQLRRLQYLARHPRLSFSLLAHIRYLVSHHLAYPFCTDFNRHILERQGLDDEDFKRMEEDPDQALLEDNERAMLVFVVRAVQDPSVVGAEEIMNLKRLGWEEGDMVDALAQGVGMIDHSIMMQVFRMDQECLRN